MNLSGLSGFGSDWLSSIQGSSTTPNARTGFQPERSPIMGGLSAERNPQLSNEIARLRLRDMVAEASVQQVIGTQLLLNSLGSFGAQHSSAKQATDAYRNQMNLQK